MTQPGPGTGAFEIGTGVVEIVAGRRGLRQQVRVITQEAGAGQHIDVPVRAQMDSFVRDVNGRLHDLRGRFVSEGRESGRQYGNALAQSMSRSFRRSFRQFMGGLDFLPTPPAKFVAIAAAIAPLAMVVGGLASSLGLAATSAAALLPALIGLVAAGGLVMGVLKGITERTDYWSVRTTNALNLWKNDLKELRRIGGGAFLPGVEAFLLSARTLLPDVRLYTRMLGNELRWVAQEAGDFVSSALFRDRLRTVMGNNVTAVMHLSHAVGALGTVVMDVSAAASRLLPRLAEAIARGSAQLAIWVEAKMHSGELADYFDRAGDAMATWWSILTNTLVGLVNILRAANPAGEKMAATLEDITRQFADWTGSTEGQERLRRFFDFLYGVDYGHLLQVAMAVGAIGLAIKGLTLAQGAAGVITTLAGLGPVGLAIGAAAVAVVAMAGAMAYLYTTSEPVKAAVDGIWRSFTENLMPVFRQFGAFVMQNIVPAMRDGFIYYLSLVAELLVNTVFPALREAAEGVLPVLEQAWARITRAFFDNREELTSLINFLRELARFIWENVIPVLGYLAQTFVTQVGYGISIIINVIGVLVNVVKGVVDAFQFVYNLVTPILTALSTFIASIMSIIVQLWGVAWQWIYDLLVLRFGGIWGKVVEIGESIRASINIKLEAIKMLWNLAWSWIHDKTAGWGQKVLGIANALKDGFVAAFKAIPAGIVGAINAMINLVNSAIGQVNKILPKRMEIPKLGTIEVPKFASGGMIRGPGTGTSDSIPLMTSMGPIMGSDGEFMIKARSTRGLLQDFGPRFLDWLNNYDIRRGDSSAVALRPRGYALGGMITATQNWIKAQDPKPYVLGSNGPDAWDCSSLVGGVWAMLAGRDPYRRYFTTYTLPGAGGFKPGRGLFTIGLSREHVVGNFAGLPFEAANPSDGVIVGAGATSVNAMPAQYYLPEMGEGFLGDGDGGLFSDMVGRAIDKAAGAVRGQLPRPGGLADNIISGIFERTVSGLKEIEFDSGGVLYPGRTLVANRSGQRERVLSPAQTRAWESSGGVTYRFEPGAFTIDMSKIKSVEDLIQLVEDITRTARQHRS